MKNQKGFWFQNLEMKITVNIEPEEEMTPRIVYSVSALLKLNSILAVKKTVNVDLLLMLENKELMLATAVVSGGFGRRATIRAAPRTSMRLGRSILVATLSIVITMLFGPLYG